MSILSSVPTTQMIKTLVSSSNNILMLDIDDICMHSSSFLGEERLFPSVNERERFIYWLHYDTCVGGANRSNLPKCARWHDLSW